MMDADKILIVEDEREIGELVRDYLQVEGYQVILAFDGEMGFHYFKQEQPTLVVLDIMLPKLDGVEVCRKIRAESHVPIMMMSAKKNETDKIIALGIGADDYITKPFSPGELVARIKAQIRRFKHMSDPKQKNHILHIHDLMIDEQAYKVTVRGKHVDVSAKEFKLLHFLASRPGQVFSKEQIYDHLWSHDRFGDMNTVTVYIRKIREKIEGDPSKPLYIKTVWGIGYTFDGSLS